MYFLALKIDYCYQRVLQYTTNESRVIYLWAKLFFIKLSLGILHTYKWFLIAHSEISCNSYPNVIFARTNACTSPHCAVALWTFAGGVHIFVQADILTLPCVGNRLSKGRSPIQLSEVTVWPIWKGMWKSFIFLDLS